MSIGELINAERVDLGTSEWLTINQDRIDQFADATSDHQWIHVDAERAAVGPYATTIAQGFLTLSLIPRLVGPLLDVTDATTAVNYGLDRVRFTTPVPVDSRVRIAAMVVDTEARGGGVMLTIESALQIDGEDRPAFVATSLSLRLP